MADALSIWQPICDRLRSAVPALKKVAAAWDLASVVEQSQVTPAAFVIYDGEDMADQASTGKKVLESQQFVVVLAVRNAADTLGGSGAAEDARAIRAGIYAALSGWKPGPEHRPMTRARTRYHPHYTPGFAYLPTAFETKSFFP